MSSWTHDGFKQKSVAEEGGSYFYHVLLMFAYHSWRSAGLNRCNGGERSMRRGKTKWQVSWHAETFRFSPRWERRKGDEQTEDTRQTLLDWNQYTHIATNRVKSLFQKHRLHFSKQTLQWISYCGLFLRCNSSVRFCYGSIPESDWGCFYDGSAWCQTWNMRSSAASQGYGTTFLWHCSEEQMKSNKGLIWDSNLFDREIWHLENTLASILVCKLINLKL